MKFDWEEFLSNDNIAVHCGTEEQAIKSIGEERLIRDYFGIDN